MKSYSNFEKVKAGKSFYAVIAVCIAALVLSVGGVYLTAGKQKKPDAPSDVKSLSLAEYTTGEARADANKPDVKDERNTTQTTHTTEPSSAAPTTEAPSTTQATTEPEAPDYGMPMGTELSKDYSPQAPVYSKTMNDWRVHSGIDFSGKEGEQVLSIANGKVKNVLSDEKWGTVIEVQYGVSLLARYCGLEQGTTVKKDDVVQKGEALGSLGTIPCEALDGAHLHFETLVDGEYTDPLEVLGKSESTFAD